MCLICVEFDRMTLVEARRNLTEMRISIGEEHAKEVDKKIEERAIEELNDLLKDFDPFISPPEFSDAEPFIDESQFDEAFGGCFMTGWDEIEFDVDDDEPLQLELEFE